MSARNLPLGYGIRVHRWRLTTYLKVSSLLLTVLVAIIAACQGPPSVTEQWTPPYLQLRLSAGKARVQWSGASDWTTIESETTITIEETGRIMADTVEGALFSLGDGSTLELDPGAIIELQNPRTFPRLEVILRDGSFLFVAQAPSYEFFMPTCSVMLLSIPSRIRAEVNGETTRLAVEEGTVTCAMDEAETLTLLACQEVYTRPGEEPEVIGFCVASTEIASPTPTLLPSPTAWWPETTATLSLSPTSTLTPTPTPTSTPTSTPTPMRRRVVTTRTHTPPPPTGTPSSSPSSSPPPPPPPPQATNTPPPPPPPTNTPPPPPPPTNTPPPPPTNTPPPPPTDAPRPTPTSPSSRPTLTPGS